MDKIKPTIKIKPVIKVDSDGYISAKVCSEQDKLVVFKFVQDMTLSQIRRKNPAVAGIIKKSLKI